MESEGKMSSQPPGLPGRRRWAPGVASGGTSLARVGGSQKKSLGYDLKM